MSEEQELFVRVRREIVTALFGVDGDAALSPSQSLKADVATTLRLCLDSLQSDVLSNARGVDFTRLGRVAETLLSLLPAQASESSVTPQQRDVARIKLEGLLAGVREADAVDEIRESALLKAEVERLKAENTELRAGQSAAAADPKSQPAVPAKPVAPARQYLS